jgi:hypothetical protein
LPQRRKKLEWTVYSLIERYTLLASVFITQVTGIYDIRLPGGEERGRVWLMPHARNLPRPPRVVYLLPKEYIGATSQLNVRFRVKIQLLYQQKNLGKMVMGAS